MSTWRLFLVVVQFLISGAVLIIATVIAFGKNPDYAKATFYLVLAFGNFTMAEANSRRKP